MRRPHQSADGQVEAWGTELALVSAPRIPGENAMWCARVVEHCLHHQIDVRFLATAALLRQVPCVADAGERKPMADAVKLILVLVQPAERTDRAGCEQE